MKGCLIIFAKEPKRDKVKTRLKHCLSEEGCLNLYKAFLKDTINIAKKVKADTKIFAYESASGPKYLRRVARSFRLCKQEGKNLGQRMHNAIKSAIKEAMVKAVVIGSDSPTLPPAYIEAAFCKLDSNDVVLGPSDDGGYYLIGVKKPCSVLFKGIKWSSSSVFKDTLKNVKILKKRVAVLDRWYDVDDSGGLVNLREKLKREKDKNVAIWTRRFLKI